MKIELCTDSFDGALMAQKYNAKRIELCSALSVGGLTPSPSLTEKCTAIKSLETHVMIRPREGNFVYSDLEMEIMTKDIELQAKSGAKGVVFACLTNDNNVNIQKNISLVEEARKYGLECTFHRAFDFVNSPFEALESIINIGFHRILTSGGKPTAIEGIENIRLLVQKASGQLEIMAGSGVSAMNALQLAATGIQALHFTSHKSKISSLGMGSLNEPDEEKIKSISSLFS